MSLTLMGRKDEPFLFRSTSPSAFAGVPPGQCPPEGSVLEAGHLFRAAGEDLDVFRAHSHPLHGADEGPAPGSAAAVQRLHRVQSEKTND